MKRQMARQMVQLRRQMVHRMIEAAAQRSGRRQHRSAEFGDADGGLRAEVRTALSLTDLRTMHSCTVCTGATFWIWWGHH